MNKQEEIVVLLNGEIDHHRAEQLRTELDRIIEVSHPKKMILDFTGVTLMDSSGIGLMIGRYKKLKERSARLCVRKLSSRIEGIFEVSGLFQVIEKI